LPAKENRGGSEGGEGPSLGDGMVTDKGKKNREKKHNRDMEKPSKKKLFIVTRKETEKKAGDGLGKNKDISQIGCPGKMAHKGRVGFR